MHDSIQVIRDALGYAKFSNKEIEDKLTEHLKVIGTDLEQVNYEPNDDIVRAVKEFNDLMNEVDAEAEAAEDEDEDEDEDELDDEDVIT